MEQTKLYEQMQSAIRNGLILVADNHNFSNTLKEICTLIGKNRSRLKYIQIKLKEFSYFHFISREGLFATNHECLWSSYMQLQTKSNSWHQFLCGHTVSSTMLPDVGIWCNTLVCGNHTANTSPHDIPSCFCPFCAIPTSLLFFQKIFILFYFLYFLCKYVYSFLSLAYYISASFG